jgi:uncharacterized protein YndB with AHSA1/START domain
MPINKDFKKLVRARMSKTGESYTAARAQLLRKPALRTASAPLTAAPEASLAASKPDYAKLAGMSDAAIEKRTGCKWEKWVWALDYKGADGWSHRAIADYVSKAYKTGDWWAQAVTVGYERIKGLRNIGQRRGGNYEANKSKTIAAPAARVSRAFTDSRLRCKWLPGVPVTIRKNTPGKSVRMTWQDGTSVEVWLTAKGAKTATAVTHTKLAGKEDSEARKRYWDDKLKTLASLLERDATKRAS